MSSHPSKRDPLLRKSGPQLRNEESCAGFCKTLCVVCTIFLASAPVAAAFATLFIHFFEGGSSVLDVIFPPAASCGKRIIGYFTHWETPLVTEKQLKKLTHVVYLFANVEEDGSIKMGSDDSESRFLDMKDKARGLKSGPKIMIAIGGAANSAMYPPVVSDSGKRKKLVNSIVAFVDEHGLDGVEIWTYSFSSNKLNHSRFIRELKKELNQLKTQKKRSEDYIISLIVPLATSHLGSGYYLNEIIRDIDFLNVLTYNYNTNRNQAGPRSPLYGGLNGNIDETMQFLACKTRQPSKLNMAVPFFGTHWRDVSFASDSNVKDLFSKPNSARGFWPVRWNVLAQEGYMNETAKFDEKTKTSYIWKSGEKNFISFENERSLLEKAKYIKNHNLGGFLIWAIDQDDEDNTLLDIVSSADICSGKDKDIVEYLCV
ncbi:hypothetical protein CAEBREN_30819 [Caenorhabditis brenneri]|uniref:GH18 domain-containing protein n=1 Tax=Caenorhabditis brenneri TaxID=135651 RepID=G0NAL1_CAEBE|nr:hypothetical protein CAEBREN_30819 [Caenorhabditis brenneri]